MKKRENPEEPFGGRSEEDAYGEFSTGEKPFQRAYHFEDTVVENDPERDYFMCPEPGCGLEKKTMKLGENKNGEIITTFTCPQEHQWVYNAKTKKIEHAETKNDGPA